MNAGRLALQADDHDAAHRWFTRAHGLGHNVRREHFAAHRGLIRTAWRARRYDRVGRNMAELAAGFLFDWPRPATARRGPSVG